VAPVLADPPRGIIERAWALGMDRSGDLDHVFHRVLVGEAGSEEHAADVMS